MVKKEYICGHTSCRKRCKNNRDLDKHLNTKHILCKEACGLEHSKQVETGFNCLDCGKILSSKQRLNTHIISKHEQPTEEQKTIS
ncbi:C2H2-type zinc finger-containing protein [Dictyostelium discoideum AX4]|uniref:C2H2-type zinc finger-containing protein n=1 Tax=Dictyostelium discoideum TaxID=44689 RepID=Q54MT5_DICDI|nr:C2H2-type zinc finger-containing protein [Dictyostelium discoideum AX4]EAL64674.1 C2H2-type zinc finger-containing protein [Dictyostelium discoideum AX4]|eukprot:XP_638208.1 C2H2-type zinc finger-containing protein [Dictyostelium discoideum AX4]